MRPVPDACLDLLKRFEGFSPRARDDEGRPMIGYGHDIFSPNDPLLTRILTEAEAAELALQDLIGTARRLEAVLGDFVTARLSDGQWAALIDFAFNEGIGRFEGSTLLTKVRAGDMAAASREFDRWIYARNGAGQEIVEDGLVARRAAERALWDGHSQ